MKKNLILSAALNIVLAGVCLILLARLGSVEQTEIAEVSPDPIAASALETETVAEPNVAEVESMPVVETDERTRPELSGLEPEEQIAALVEEGWSEEDAKLYAFGRTVWENTKVMMERFGDSGNE